MQSDKSFLDFGMNKTLLNNKSITCNSKFKPKKAVFFSLDSKTRRQIENIKRHKDTIMDVQVFQFCILL